jgi:uncharacterized protein (DUF1330 family)
MAELTLEYRATVLDPQLGVMCRPTHGRARGVCNSHTMSAFLIVNYDIDNPELYAEYQAGAISALRVGTECEVVVFDPDSQHVEGDSTGRQTVVLKFDSMEKAREIYESGEYQAIVGKRHAASSNHFAVLVNTLS